MNLPIEKHTLANGLTVILRESHHVPVASFWIWYRVGSRNESPGLTGASHWVEHMYFKQSAKYAPGVIDKAVGRAGGHVDAMTSMDFTAYYATLPSSEIDLVLDFEADRLKSAIFSEEEVASERTVILSERHWRENEPTVLLYEEMLDTAFQVHNYRHPVIGLEEDLKSMTRDDLYSHFRRYYAPNNATVVAAGDFETSEMLSRIEDHFGSIPAGEVVNQAIAGEPGQKEEKRVVVRGPGETAYLAVGFHAPSAGHPDFKPLVLLNAAYAGGGSLGTYGGGGTNKSSRLYKALVNTNLAAAVSAGVTPTIDPFLYTVFAVARPDSSVDQIEKAFDEELERLAEEPITQAELEKALKRAKAQFVMAGESVTGQCQMIGMAETLVGDYKWYESTLEALQAVTLADLEEVRKKYLRKQNRIVGIYEPAGNGAIN